MSTGMRIVAHVLIFLAAFVVFFIGLFVGLQVNSNGGTALWLTAAAIAALNLVWIVRSGRKRGENL